MPTNGRTSRFILYVMEYEESANFKQRSPHTGDAPVAPPAPRVDDPHVVVATGENQGGQPVGGTQYGAWGEQPAPAGWPVTVGPSPGGLPGRPPEVPLPGSHHTGHPGTVCCHCAGPAERSPRTALRLWRWVGVGVCALLLAVSGVSAYLIGRNGQQPAGASAPSAPPVPSEPSAPAPAAVPTGTVRDLSSRAVDPAPLSIDEVFPQPEIIVRIDGPSYQMIKAYATQNCPRIATGELRTLLEKVDCGQAVYGTMRSSDGDYLLSAGILNLADENTANRLYHDVKPILDERRGQFQPPQAGTDSNPVSPAAVRTGWHAQAHFLLYCVLVHADGTKIDDSEENVRQILSDLVENHLGSVVQQRAQPPTPVDD